jgi:putative N6-adenine-specific DNA methylase
MSKDRQFEIFLVTPPGLEAALYDEVRTKGFKGAKAIPGGVTIKGGWPEVWRANLWVRGASRVLARIDQFHIKQLSDLDNRMRQVRWRDVLRADVPVRVEVTCVKSKIYHSDAARERIETAITTTLGAPLVASYAQAAPVDAAHGADGPDQQDGPIAPATGVLVMVRFDNDICTISVDTSGELLHKRGYKLDVTRAPMRETMASLFLRQCGYTGTEPVVDPMCGSGTFIIEAAEIAARLNPGRARPFAFEQLATFDVEAWGTMRAVKSAREPTARFYGRDRDGDAITNSVANAARAGVEAWTDFKQATVSDLTAPEGPPDGPKGLVIVNPPYGSRLGDVSKLFPLYRALGQTLKTHFAGWRVGLITTEASLAHATALPFKPNGAPVPHGGLRVTLYQTEPLVGPLASAAPSAHN